MAEMKVSDDQLIAALREHGSNRKAAQALGIHRSVVDRRRAALARKGFSPEHGLQVPYHDGYVMGKTTIQRGPTGEIERTWERMIADQERMQELITEAMAAMVKDLPKLPRRPCPKHKFLPDLMACYPLGDPHVGMRAWAEECGKDWDLAIAERTHCLVVRDLVHRAPDAEQAVIINLGDLFHYDSLEAKTPTHGFLLDADGRYAKMIEVGVLMMRQLIEAALEKHKRVRVINVRGNHDPTGAIWLSLALRQAYANNPRVEIDRTIGVHSYIEFGANLIGLHHGHSTKVVNLPLVMAADKPEAWGRTKYRAWWTGHVHHASAKEHPGVKVETFNTLAPNDAHAAEGGYRSAQLAQCIILHREFGELTRHSSHPAMV